MSSVNSMRIKFLSSQLWEYIGGDIRLILESRFFDFLSLGVSSILAIVILSSTRNAFSKVAGGCGWSRSNG